MKKVVGIISISIFFAVVVTIGGLSVLKNNFPFKTPSKYESFVKENIPQKESFTALHKKSAALMGERTFDDVYFDKENDRLVEILQPDEQKTQASVDMINDFKAATDKPVYVMLVPTSSGIYGADLPDKALGDSQQKLIDDIYYKIDESVTALDVFGALYSARENEIYFRSDSRWTQLGAYTAYKNAAPKMGLNVYSYKNYDVDQNVGEPFYGNLSRRSGFETKRADTLCAYRPKYGSYVESVTVTGNTDYTRKTLYVKNALKSEDKYSYYLGSADFEKAVISAANKDLPRLLIVGSDYADCFVTFLAPHFSKITIINPDNLSVSLSEAASEWADYDSVLFLSDLKSFCE